MKLFITVLLIIFMYILSALYIQDKFGDVVSIYCAIVSTMLVFIVFPFLQKTRD